MSVSPLDLEQGAMALIFRDPKDGQVPGPVKRRVVFQDAPRTAGYPSPDTPQNIPRGQTDKSGSDICPIWVSRL